MARFIPPHARPHVDDPVVPATHHQVERALHDVTYLEAAICFLVNRSQDTRNKFEMPKDEYLFFKTCRNWLEGRNSKGKVVPLWGRKTLVFKKLTAHDQKNYQKVFAKWGKDGDILFQAKVLISAYYRSQLLGRMRLDGTRIE